jgi:hypothetical protein
MAATKQHKNYTPETLEKINAFMDAFKKDPEQLVELLCNQLHLGKSLLYEWLRLQGMSLEKIRATSRKNSVMKKEEDIVVETDPQEKMLENIAIIDNFRNQGLQLEAAIKKSGINIKPSKYYYYKQREIPEQQHKPIRGRPANNSKKKTTTTAIAVKQKQKRPMEIMTPHIIEYVEKPSVKAKKPTELLMMLGSPEALLDFVKKLQGGNND